MDEKRWKLPLKRVPIYESQDKFQYWNNTHPIYEQTLFGGVSKISFSPNNKYLAAVSSNHSLVLRIPPTEGAVWNEQQSRKCMSIRFRQDSRLVVSGVEKRVVIKSTDTAYERQLQAHTRDVHDATFITAQQIVSAGDDNVVRLWDFVAEVELEHSTPEGHTDYVRSVECVDNSTFLSGSYDHKVHLWDVRQSLERPVSTWEVSDPIQALTYIQHRSLICCGAADVLSCFDLREAQSKPIHQGSHHTKAITAVAYIPEQDTVVTASLDKRLQFVSIDPAVGFKVIATRKHSDGITAVSVNPKASLLAFGDSVGRLQLLEVEKLTDTRNLEGDVSANAKREKVFQAKAEEVRTLLVRFRYQKALETALYSRQQSVILTLLEELVRRGALRVAVSGHNDRSMIQLLKFCTQHIDLPDYTSLCCHVIDVIMEIYGPVASSSRVFHQELLKAAKLVEESLEAVEQMAGCIGLMQLAVDFHDL